MEKSIKGKTGVFVPLSFTKFERICKDHVATEQRLCFYEKTGKACNKMNCPKFNE